MLKHILGWTITTHYLDDFIRIVPCELAPAIAQDELDYSDLTNILGIPRNLAKDCRGTTVEVLGIEIDTTTLEARLPIEKLEKAVTATANCLSQHTLSLKAAQQLGGFLNFCCKVVRVSRAFMSSLWEFIAAFSKSRSTKRRINFCLRQDLRWWHTTLPLVNGILFFDNTHRRTVQIFTDACPLGLGGFYYFAVDKEWRDNIYLIERSHSFTSQIPTLHLSEQINTLELRAILFAFQLWGLNFHRCRVVVNTDNTTAHNGLVSRRLRGRSNIPLREILCIAAHHDITIEPRWLSSKDNALADALSRDNSTTVANFVYTLAGSSIQLEIVPSFLPTETESPSHQYAQLLWAGLSPGTRRSYRAAVQSYEHYCGLHMIVAWPASEESLGRWIATRAFGSTDRYQGQIKPDTLQSYVSALRSYHVDHGLATSVFRSPRLDRLIQGARSLFPGPRRERLPITRELLTTVTPNRSPLTIFTSTLPSNSPSLASFVWGSSRTRGRDKQIHGHSLPQKFVGQMLNLQVIISLSGSNGAKQTNCIKVSPLSWRPRKIPIAPSTPYASCSAGTQSLGTRPYSPSPQVGSPESS